MQSAENGTILLQARERLGEQLIYYRCALAEALGKKIRIDIID